MSAIEVEHLTKRFGDLAVLAGWAVTGLAVSARFFRWDPVRPAHARRTLSGAGSGLDRRADLA